MELFHKIALEEYYKAILEDKEQNSEYVKSKVYERYEAELQKERSDR